MKKEVKMFFKRDTYKITAVRPPQMRETMCHVDYIYWDIKGKKHQSKLCIDLGYSNDIEEIVHQEIRKEINTKFRNANVDYLQKLVGNCYKL
jgi:hypothetical protein